VSLRIPGPTPCPENVLQAMSKQMINHRGKEFAELIREATSRLKEFYQTKEDRFSMDWKGRSIPEWFNVKEIAYA